MRILSLCGGGTSGYMTSRFLEKIELEIEQSIFDSFDLIAGTSTGALIGGLISLNKTPYEIIELYKTLHKDIFGNGRNFFMNLFNPKYDSKKFKTICEKVFGEVVLKDLKKHFMSVSLQLNEPVLKPKFWKSWNTEDENVRLSDCVIASASAPGAFKPYKIDKNYYYDGGLIANDPTLCAVADAIDHFGIASKDIKVLTIQTDFHGGYKNPESFGGLMSIVSEIPSFCVDGSERMVQYITNRIFDNLSSVYISPKVYYQMDDSDWNRMDITVEKTWKIQRDEILDFFEYK